MFIQENNLFESLFRDAIYFDYVNKIVLMININIVEYNFLLNLKLNYLDKNKF